MTKSSVTIRRRKTKYNQNDFDRLRDSRPQSPEPALEPAKFNEDDDGYMFDDEVLGPSIVKRIMSSERTLLLALVSARVVNSLFIQTSYVPDEYWQSIEVAHNMAFGYPFRK